MPAAITKPRRRHAILKATLCLALIVGVTALAVEVFRLGFITGLAAAGGGLVLYQVPAAIFDWPRLTLQDVVDFVLGIFAAVGAFFAALFSW